jgi:hypothetical protein
MAEEREKANRKRKVAIKKYFDSFSRNPIMNASCSLAGG